MNILRPEPKQKRPADAKKVFGGVIFDVYQWQQKMFDGSEATFEQLARPDTADIIAVTPEGKIVILNEEQPGDLPSVNFPGGRVDAGESPEQAVRRELKEETGYEIDKLELWITHQPYSKIDWMIYTFIGHGAKKTSQPKADVGERMTVREVSLEDLFKIAREEGSFLHTDIALRFYRAMLEPAYYQELKQKFGVI